MKVRKKRKNAGYNQAISHAVCQRRSRRERFNIENTEQMVQDPVTGISYIIVSN